MKDIRIGARFGTRYVSLPPELDDIADEVEHFFPDPVEFRAPTAIWPRISRTLIQAHIRLPPSYFEGSWERCPKRLADYFFKAWERLTASEAHRLWREEYHRRWPEGPEATLPKPKLDRYERDVL